MPASKPFLFVMVGLPCSGKSLIASGLNRLLKDSVVLSSDSILERLAIEKGTSYAAEWENSYGLAAEEIQVTAREAFQGGKTVIWDQTNMTCKARRRAKAMAPRNYTKVIVNVDVDLDRIAMRLERRNELAGNNGKFISMSVIRDMQLQYVRPDREAEGYDHIVTIANNATMAIGDDANQIGNGIAKNIMQMFVRNNEF